MKRTLKDRLKQTTRNERLAVLGLVAVLVLVAGGAVYGQVNHKTEKATHTEKVAPTETKEDKKDTRLSDAEKAVTDVETTPSRDKLQVAQELVDKVTDKEKKQALNKRLEAVKQALDQIDKDQQLLAEAENKVKHLEDHQMTENLQPAQEALNQVVDADKKAALQHRLDLVNQAIAARQAQAEQAAQTQVEQAAQAVQTPTDSQSPAYQEPASNDVAVALASDSGNPYTAPQSTPQAPLTAAQIQQQVDDAAKNFNNQTYQY